MTTTFDTRAKGPNLTLSGGNLTWVNGASNVDNIVKGQPAFISGKWYWEATMTTINNTGVRQIGVMNTSMNVATWLGSDANSLGMTATGIVSYNNATLTTIQTYAAGNNVSVALDVDNSLIYFRTNGGNWNNSGTANPATQTGGISISGIKTQGVLIPAMAGFALNDGATINFGDSSFSFTAPSGFSAANTYTPLTTALAVKRNGEVASNSASFTQYGKAAGPAAPSGSQNSSLPAPKATAFKNAWYGGNRLWSPAATMTQISGQVRQSGTPTPGKTVFLHDSLTGFLLGSAVSDGSGNFAIPALGRTNVYAVCLDPAYQAIVYDQLTPV